MTFSTTRSLTAASLLIIGASIIAGSSPAYSDESVSVITSRDVPVTSMSKGELRRIYRGKKRLWENNLKIRAYYLAGNTEAGRSFFNSVLDFSYSKFRKHWIRMTFSGAATPPTLESDVAKLIASVCGGSGAVGFVPTDGSIDAKGCQVIAITE